ncbi:MAG: G/U mismatch-specific DNA glycosylase [Acidobacteria bacterium]|nr:G/U mismatch-specific DNA glycosylase [Acidobacteriota bacterium]
MKNAKPSKEELRAAVERTTDELIDYDLKVLFCGINPGLWSAATGHNFARPGNRFWKTLHRAGFTDWQFDPSEERGLLRLGFGITNFCPRATARADELTDEEIGEGGRRLVEKIEKYRPRILAVLGITPYRVAFAEPRAKIGPQPAKIGETRIWVLPNPSGLNAHYQIDDLTRLFREMRESVEP